jgi:hypothetical protein
VTIVENWMLQHTREVRARLATFAMDWDDPSMDIYNETNGGR